MSKIKKILARPFKRVTYRADKEKILIKPSERIVRTEKAYYKSYRLQPSFERDTTYRAKEMKGDLILTTERLTFITEDTQIFNVPTKDIVECGIISSKEIEISVKERDEVKRHSLRVSKAEKWRRDIEAIKFEKTKFFR